MRRDRARDLVVLGVVLELLGLGLDGVLHGRDPALAANEGVFAPGNPGHLIFGVGLGLTLLGAMALLHRRTTGRGAGVGLAALGTAAVAAGGGVAAMGGGGHAHGAGAGHPTAMSQRAWERVDATLRQTRDATRAYRSVAAARVEGYVQWTSNSPGDGEHWINPRRLASGRFDARRPAVLVYARGHEGRRTLAGVAWMLPRRGSKPPPSPLGPLALWHHHAHDDMGCLRGVGSVLRTRHVSREDCRGTGETFVAKSPWMLHAWLYRPAPEGLFGATNSSLRGGSVPF